MLQLDPILPLWLLAPLFVALAAFDWRHARRRQALAKTGRVALWLIIAILALRPSRVVVSEIVDRARLYLIQDLSDSMSVRDAEGGESRSAALAAARRQYSDAIAGLSRHFDLRELNLGRDLAPTGSPVDASATAIGDGLAVVADAAAGSRVAAAVLFSDGRTTAGTPIDLAAARLASLDVPIHSVQVGRDSLADDVVDAAILDIEAPLTCEIGSDVSVTISGVFRNLSGQAVTILAAVDDAPLAPVDELTPATDNDSYRHSVQVAIPAEPGFHTLTVAVQSKGHEITPLNNRMSTPFRARDDAIRILLLEGALRPDFKFLRRLLEDNDAFAPTIAPPFLLASAAGPNFLAELKLAQFDVVILGDLSREQLPSSMLSGIAGLVRDRGAGLFVLGGPRNLDSAYWRDHPLAPALPILFSAGAPPPTSQSFAPKPPSPPPNHFIAATILDPAYAPVWQLPQLRGVRNPGATTLPLGTTLLADQANLPLLATSDFGSGRVVATLHDASWNWQTESDPAPAFYRELMTRIIYFLASREDAMNSRLSISAGRARIRLDTPLQIRGHLLGASGAPVTGANVQLSLRHLESGEATTAPMTSGHGRYLGTLSAPKPGAYAIQATTVDNNSQLLSNELRIIVYDERIEDRNLLADTDALASLAATTDGTYRPLSQLADLLEFLPTGARTVTIRNTESSQTLWDKWPFFILLLVAASLTWWPPRKKSARNP